VADNFGKKEILTAVNRPDSWTVKYKYT